MINKIFTALFLVFSYTVTAQFEVEFNEINGSLTQADKFEKDFGRYDGFEIPLYENEAVNFVVYSEIFLPKLIFVSPSGSVFRQAQAGGNRVASIIASIPETGEWLLYVVGDSSAIGNYLLQYALASSNSTGLPKEADFCTTINFLTVHSKAYFLLLENIDEIKEKFVKLENALDTFFDEENGSFVVKLYEGNDLTKAELVVKNMTEELSKCVEKQWNAKNESWKNLDDFRIKTNAFIEQTNEKERFVRVELYDLKKSKQKFTGDYVVQFVIGKNG